MVTAVFYASAESGKKKGRQKEEGEEGIWVENEEEDTARQDRGRSVLQHQHQSSRHRFPGVSVTRRRTKKNMGPPISVCRRSTNATGTGYSFHTQHKTDMIKDIKGERGSVKRWRKERLSARKKEEGVKKKDEYKKGEKEGGGSERASEAFFLLLGSFVRKSDGWSHGEKKGEEKRVEKKSKYVPSHREPSSLARSLPKEE